MKTIYIIALLLMVFTKGYSLEQIKISVDNVQRDFLLYVPENSTQKKLPVVFVFHGYGQELTEAIGKFKIEKYWPEAIVVYPRGLRTVIQKWKQEVLNQDGKHMLEIIRTEISGYLMKY